MRFVNIPDLSDLGLRKATVVYAGELWPKKANRMIPDPDFIRSTTIPKVRKEQPDLVIIDVEHWKLSDIGASQVDHNIDRYLTILQTFRRQLSGVKIGLYGMLPIRNYWAPVRGDSAAISDWQAENRRLQRLAEAVDIIFPSLYTFYDDPAGWVTYAVANINEARSYGKPVYAFLWPQYHKTWQPIAADFWRKQLETTYANADGMVIWTPAKGRPRWDPSAHWWRETVAFLEASGLTAVPSGN